MMNSDFVCEAPRDIKINELYFNKMDFPTNKTLSELFSEQAKKNPTHTALVFGQQKLTYNELNNKTDALASVLRNIGVNRNVVVGILCKQSPELIIGIISILKAGGAFFVIDPNYPEDRVNFMLEDSKIDILLSKTNFTKNIKFAGQIVDLDEYVINNFDNNTNNLVSINEASDLAYILYTSGTTGAPKAAMVEHRNAINALFYLNTQLSADSTSRVMQFFSPSFSVSYQEIFITLLFGGVLYIIDEDTRSNIVKLLDFINKEEINILFLPSSYLKLIVNEEKYYQKLSKSIKQIVTAGEQIILNGKFVKYLKDNNINLHNNYGTSESHIASMLNINELEKIDTILPIGKPIANTYIYILNESLEPQPEGKDGEIYISGDSVSRGYYNKPELTAERFIANPFINGKTMYKTGDLGKWLPDGNIQLLGRTDYQVKVRGFRIELEEIEYNLLKHPQVKEAVVVAKQSNISENFLYAYIVTDRPVQSDEVKSFLATKIPEYMMPAYIIRLEELPKTLAGKIDRKALIENRKIQLNDNEILNNINLSPRALIIFNELKIILESITGNELVNIDLNDNFVKLGLDSVSFIKLIADVENKFGFILDDDQLNNYDCQTINDLIACIEENIQFVQGEKYEA